METSTLSIQSIREDGSDTVATAQEIPLLAPRPSRLAIGLACLGGYNTKLVSGTTLGFTALAASVPTMAISGAVLLGSILVHQAQW